MSTSIMNKVSSEYVLDVKDSDYEFNRFDKAALRKNSSVLKLLVVGVSYSNWSGAADHIYDAIYKRYLSRGDDIYCFIASPYWKKSTSIVRHYGLSRALEKDFEVGLGSFLFEKEIVNDNCSIFYGVIKLTAENSMDVFSLLSKNDNGVLFSIGGHCEPVFNLLVQDLASILAVKPKSMTLIFNIVEAINSILDKGLEAIFPYAWEETGEYHLDIFKTSSEKNGFDIIQ